MDPDTKKRWKDVLMFVVNVGKTGFHYGFVPYVLYLGEILFILITMLSQGQSDT